MAIADGMSMALIKPLLMLVPIVIDVFFLLGASVHLTGLSQSLVRAINESGTADNGALDTAEGLATWNALEIVTIFVPSVQVTVQQSGLFSEPLFSPVDITSAGLGLLVALGLIVVSTLPIAIFLVPAADALLGRSRTVSGMIRAMSRAWARLTALVGLAILAFVAIAIPIGILMAIALGIGGASFLFALLSFAAVVAVLAVVALTWFAPEAVVLQETGPITAVRSSAKVVRAFFWPTLGFIVGASVLQLGVTQVAIAVAGSGPGVIVSIVVNASISVGITLATMRFYRDRYLFVHPGAGAPAPTGIA